MNKPTKIEEKSKAVAVKATPIAGLEDMRSEQIRIPKLRLIQPTSRERPDGASEGDWILPSVQTVLGDTVSFMPIALFHTRAMWPVRGEAAQEDQDRPLCTSRNSKVPDSGSGYPAADGTTVNLCATCPHAMWATGTDGKRVPPRCSFTINFFALLLDAEQGGLGMATISFAKSGYTCGEQIINSIAGSRGIKGVWERHFELKRKLIDRDNRYFVPTFRPLGATNEANIAEGVALHGLWKSAYQDAVTRGSFDDEATIETDSN